MQVRSQQHSDLEVSTIGLSRAMLSVHLSGRSWEEPLSTSKSTAMLSSTTIAIGLFLFETNCFVIHSSDIFVALVSLANKLSFKAKSIQQKRYLNTKG